MAFRWTNDSLSSDPTVVHFTEAYMRQSVSMILLAIDVRETIHAASSPLSEVTLQWWY